MTETWQHDRLLVDGELVPASDGGTYETIDPSSGKVLGLAADATVADARRAVAAARRAFDTTTWATDVGLRTRCLRQLHQTLADHQEALRELVVAEVGSPV
ncbi:MAG TPA: aldehyde dehydrogenase family protein, partial [Acidimicrobiales bacterium]|nr:aldehyde dehydrogenase family protein [Acidimicrobiales bacterium]